MKNGRTAKQKYMIELKAIYKTQHQIICLGKGWIQSLLRSAKSFSRPVTKKYTKI